jgi:hypothetical protein
MCLHIVKHGVLNDLGLGNREPPEWFCSRITDTRLNWYLDMQRCLEKNRATMDWEAVRERARRWNTLEEVVQCLAVLDTLLPDGEAGEALARLDVEDERAAVMTRSWMGWFYQTRIGHGLIERCMVVNPDVILRPVRFLFVGRLLFPAPRRLLRYYGKNHRVWLPLLYLVHPLNILRKQVSWSPPPAPV